MKLSLALLVSALAQVPTVKLSNGVEMPLAACGSGGDSDAQAKSGQLSVAHSLEEHLTTKIFAQALLQLSSKDSLLSTRPMTTVASVAWVKPYLVTSFNN